MDQVWKMDVHHCVTQVSKVRTHIKPPYKNAQIDNPLWSWSKAAETFLFHSRATNAWTAPRRQYHAAHYADHRRWPYDYYHLHLWASLHLDKTHTHTWSVTWDMAKGRKIQDREKSRFRYGYVHWKGEGLDRVDSATREEWNGEERNERITGVQQWFYLFNQEWPYVVILLMPGF